MKSANRFLYVVCLILLSNLTFGQKTLKREYSFDEDIKAITNYSWAFFTQTNEGVYYWNTQIPNYDDKGKIGMSPLGTEFIYLNTNGKVHYYDPLEFREFDRVSSTIAKLKPKKIFFDGLGQNIFVISTSGDFYKLIKVKNAFNHLILSKGFFVNDAIWNYNLEKFLIVDDLRLFYWSDKSNEVSVDIKFDHDITAIDVIEHKYEVGIGLANGEIVLIDQSLIGDGNRIKVSNASITGIIHHPMDHYLFIGDANGNVYVLNTLTNEIIEKSQEHSNNVSLFIEQDANNRPNLISYDLGKKIKIWNLDKFDPDYNRIVTSLVEKKVNQYLKRMPNESSQDFYSRTNPDKVDAFYSTTRQFFIDSIGTIIRNRFYQIEPVDTYYSAYKNSIEIKSDDNIAIIDDSLSITLKPFKTVKVFASNKSIETSQLEIESLSFNLLQNNQFEIKSLHMSSTGSAEPLIYDKNAIENSRRMQVAELSLARKLATEEYALKNTLEANVTNLRSRGELNDVELSMEVFLKKEKDEKGNDELNLHVSYTSQGIKAESQKNTADYPAGKYNLFDSKAATVLVDFFVKSVQNKLSAYIDPGTKITFKLTGSTDKSMVKGVLPYGNEFGVFKNFPYYFQNNLAGMNIDQIEGINHNKQLGFLRTYAVRDFIEKQTSAFEMTDNKYIHFAEVSDEFGPEFRKIKIEMIIHKVNRQSDVTTENNKKESLSDVDINIPNRSVKTEAYALIIGNEDYSSYQKGLSTESNVPYAVHDAQVVKNYLVNMFNIDDDNIELLINATYGEMSQAIAKLERIMEIDGQNKEIIFYYSGHGLPDEERNEPYLIPVDISGLNVNQGISLRDIMSRLDDKPHGKINMIIDACFSGAGKNGDLVATKGVGVVPKIPELGRRTLLLTSSSGKETSLFDKEKMHGLFTYYFLKNLKSSSGDIPIQSLFEAIKKDVALEAVKSFNKSQSPEIFLGVELIEAGNNFIFQQNSNPE